MEVVEWTQRQMAGGRGQAPWHLSRPVAPAVRSGGCSTLAMRDFSVEKEEKKTTKKKRRSRASHADAAAVQKYIDKLG